MGKGARRRRRRVAALRGGALLMVLVGGGAWLWPHLQSRLQTWRGPAEDQALVQVESQFDIAPVVRGDTFTDIPGDPIIIPPNDDGAGSGATLIPAPALLKASGRVPAGASQLAVLDSPLRPRDRQLVAALPATREQFALFQAERSRNRLMAGAPDGAGQDGSAVPQDSAATMLFLRDGVTRRPLWRETIIETARKSTILDLLAENGFATAAADRLAGRIRDQLSLPEYLARGTVLALRWRPRDGGREVIQLSLYGVDGFLGSLALSAAGQLVPAVDPWADQPLLSDTMQRGQTDAPEVQQRLMDLIYTAALQRDVPPEIIGEALALTSKVFDLDDYADPDDRLTLIYRDGGTQDPGAVMFVGIDGPSGHRACYVVPGPEGFECHSPGTRITEIGPTLLQPVAGVLSQRFIPGTSGTGQVNDEGGRVIWTAPQNTPVIAAAAGEVRVAQDGVVEIAHPGGLVSRYLGLAATEAGLAPGDAVAPGTRIGRSGLVVGGSAPGLAFQVLANGTPVDPLTMMGGAEVAASDSIESLIGHIIRIESGGNAAARNPRSTATGLGQFIEGTWLRMMRNYRPDLIARLSPREVLDLRLDAGLSRQMVRHLAQENEAYLRARGHAITPGRLYLAHFLGPAGADLALRADPAQEVGAVMGGAVVAANPFLHTWRIADLRNWAERKMSGPGGPVVAEVMPEKTASPEVRAFMAEMDRLRQGNSG